MAKKPLINPDMFARTTPEPPPADNSDLEEGNIRPVGVGLRAGEVQALDNIAAELGGIPRNQLMRFAVRWFILQFRAGKVDLSGFVKEPPPPKKRLEMPK